MKRLNYWIVLLMTATSCLLFASCGDDDENENGNGKVKTCHAKMDGRNVGFQYAYFTIDEPAYSGDMYEYTLEFTNIDYLSIMKDPRSIVGKKLSSFMIEFISPNKYDIHSLPEGEFPYSRYGSNKKYDYYSDCEIGINGVMDSSGDASCEQYYEIDGSNGYNSGNLIISKISEGLYKIEIKELNLLAAIPGDFDMNGNSGRKTTGSFYFEGGFEDLSGYDFDFD